MVAVVSGGWNDCTCGFLLQCKACDTEATRTEKFLQLDVTIGSSLSTSIAGLLEPETLDGDNK